MTSLLRSLPLCLALATAAVASISTASTHSLSAGTTFDVDGTDFRQRSSAWLEAAGKRIPLKVAKGVTPTHMTLTLKAFPPGHTLLGGPCVLRILPKGEHVAFSLSNMTLERPAVAQFAPLVAAPLATVTIDGQYFGSKRGRVRFGSSYGKVTFWSETQIKALVPRNAVAGEAVITVENRCGASDPQYGFNVAQ